MTSMDSALFRQLPAEALPDAPCHAVLCCAVLTQVTPYISLGLPRPHTPYLIYAAQPQTRV